MHYFTHGGLKKWHSSRDLDGERESWESSWRESIAGSRGVPGRGACWVLWSMTRRPMKGDGEAETLPGVHIVLGLGGHVWTLRVQVWSEDLRLFDLHSLHHLLCPKRLLCGSEAVWKQTAVRRVLPSTTRGIMVTWTRGGGSGGCEMVRFSEQQALWGVRQRKEQTMTLRCLT